MASILVSYIVMNAYMCIEREDGQMCEREEDENVQDINARRLLRGAASRRNTRNFRPVC